MGNLLEGGMKERLWRAYLHHLPAPGPSICSSFPSFPSILKTPHARRRKWKDSLQMETLHKGLTQCHPGRLSCVISFSVALMHSVMPAHGASGKEQRRGTPSLGRVEKSFIKRKKEDMQLFALLTPSVVLKCNWHMIQLHQFNDARLTYCLMRFDI